MTRGARGEDGGGITFRGMIGQPSRKSLVIKRRGKWAEDVNCDIYFARFWIQGGKKDKGKDKTRTKKWL